jgi:hypothetical protein
LLGALGFMTLETTRVKWCYFFVVVWNGNSATCFLAVAACCFCGNQDSKAKLWKSEGLSGLTFYIRVGIQRWGNRVSQSWVEQILWWGPDRTLVSENSVMELEADVVPFIPNIIKKS